MEVQIIPLIRHHLCLLCSHGGLVMDDTHRSAFARFLFVYKGVVFKSVGGIDWGGDPTRVHLSVR